MLDEQLEAISQFEVEISRLIEEDKGNTPEGKQANDSLKRSKELYVQYKEFLAFWSKEKV